MYDIAKCTGDGCQIKHQCLRYTAKPARLWQNWMMPLSLDNCQEYIEDKPDVINTL